MFKAVCQVLPSTALPTISLAEVFKMAKASSYMTLRDSKDPVVKSKVRKEAKGLYGC